MAARRLNRSVLAKIGRRVRYLYLKLLLVPDTPHRVALGLAIGIFVGFTPTVPLQTIIVLPIAWLLRGSKIAAIVGIWISNPLTIPPIYAAVFYIGRLITPFGRNSALPENWDFSDLVDVGWDAALAGIAGGIVLGTIAAPLTYYLFKKNIGKLQAWERRKLREKFGLSPPNTE